MMRRVPWRIRNALKIGAVVTAVLLASWAVLTRGELRVAGAVDTVAVTDTVVRVDTVLVRDSTIGVEAPSVFEAAGTLDSIGSIDGSISALDIDYLRGRKLLIPVASIRATELVNTFDEAREAGARRHDALDILAPRGTPVLSADSGPVVMIDTSARGGLSLYATDPSGRFVYYYAHLDRYRAGIREKLRLRRGDTIGYVGTTGNAPVNTPHLHFAINKLTTANRWWDGTAINPWPLLTGKP